jgi:hypothetical protein
MNGGAGQLATLTAQGRAAGAPYLATSPRARPRVLVQRCWLLAVCAAHPLIIGTRTPAATRLTQLQPAAQQARCGEARQLQALQCAGIWLSARPEQLSSSGQRQLAACGQQRSVGSDAEILSPEHGPRSTLRGYYYSP